jgi:hypothetical protein
VILSFEKGGHTDEFPAAFMRHSVEDLVTFPSSNDLRINVDLVRQLSPDSISMMEFKSDLDITIARKMAQFPLLGQKIDNTWNLVIKREFDMTNDSHLFKQENAEGRLPLYEGKMIHQFTHQWGNPKYWLNESEARESLLKRGEKDLGQLLPYQYYRLGFRDIGHNTDIRTMIMCMLPRSIFCNHNTPTAVVKYSEKDTPTYTEELFVCAVMNSFAADYIFRQRVTTNLTFFIVNNLSVPRLTKADRTFNQIVDRAAKLICTTPEFDDLAAEVGLSSHTHGITDPIERAKLRAELDGTIAHLYGLTEFEFAHILTTFPIVPQPTKDAALQAYRDYDRGLIL